jgi:arabinose-5-phosphate isomerase
MYDKHLRDCLENLNTLPTGSAIERVVEEFSKHKRVIFCTMGKSAYACRKVVFTARSYGMDWHDLDVCHAFHGDAGIIKEGDLLVMVSKSGKTRETIQVAEYFSDWKRIAVCSDPESPLVMACDDSVIIPVSRESSPFGYAPMVSTAMYLVVLHGILCESVENSGCTIEQYARNHPSGDIGTRLKNARNK